MDLGAVSYYSDEMNDVRKNENPVEKDSALGPPEIKNKSKQSLYGRQILKGQEVEKEHKETIDWIKHHPETPLENATRSIAFDHLKEDPEYYTHLKDMEEKYKKSSLIGFYDELEKIGISNEFIERGIRSGEQRLKKLETPYTPQEWKEIGNDIDRRYLSKWIDMEAIRKRIHGDNPIPIQGSEWYKQHNDLLLNNSKYRNLLQPVREEERDPGLYREYEIDKLKPRINKVKSKLEDKKVSQGITKLKEEANKASELLKFNFKPGDVKPNPLSGLNEYIPSSKSVIKEAPKGLLSKILKHPATKVVGAGTALVGAGLGIRHLLRNKKRGLEKQSYQERVQGLG